MMTGEWSDDSSKVDLQFIYALEISLVMQKSIKSGIFFLSVGQLVGSPEEAAPSCKVSMACSSLRPLVVMVSEP